MVEVAFHTGIADCGAYACRLLRKAARQGARVLVSGPTPTLEALDRQLWTFEALAFVAHLRIGPRAAPGAALRRTPIWLSAVADVPERPPVLVNLGADPPSDLEGLQRVVEIVGCDEDERRAARGRWRDYAARGCTITHHAQERGQ